LVQSKISARFPPLVNAVFLDQRIVVVFLRSGFQRCGPQQQKRLAAMRQSSTPNVKATFSFLRVRDLRKRRRGSPRASARDAWPGGRLFTAH
jgi:hypothetical protein